MKRTLFIIASLSILAGSAMAEGVENRASIQATAEAFMLKLARAEHTGKAGVKAGRLDSRLRLAKCDVPLQAFQPSGGRTLGNTTVGVRCEGSNTWSLYVPVKVSVLKHVVVATRPLQKGMQLDHQDLKLIEADVSGLRSGYYSELAEVVGKRLTRSIKMGREITINGVKKPLQVKRGQSIELVAQAGGLRVQMKGKALADGSTGQRIPVRNLSSNRVVEGVVTSPTTVLVNL